MKDLLVEDVAPIYKKNYWDKMKGDDLPGGLDLCVFDFGVNAGPGRAAKYLQTMIGTVADGGIGPNTLAKLKEYVDAKGLVESIEEYQNRRQEYYEKLSTFATFGRGWTRRVNETTELAKKLI
jgi:lysozyme family protein